MRRLLLSFLLLGSLLRGASLTVTTDQPIDQTFNLTTEGNLDWVAYSQSHFALKYIPIGARILNTELASIGGATQNDFCNDPNYWIWTDGDPALIGPSGDTDCGIYVAGVGSGLQITATATTRTRTLTVRTGFYYSTVQVVAHLADGSASDYNVSFPSAGDAKRSFYINYKANTDTTLTFTLTITGISDQFANVAINTASIFGNTQIPADRPIEY
jgi:hypothetical protein